MAAFQGAATGVDSATLPAHIAGDLITIFAFRDGSGGAPTLPVGYTPIATADANNASFTFGVKIAAGASETSGTWTNATSLCVQTYRQSSGGTLSIGSTPALAANGFSTNIDYAALTMDVTDGSSLVGAYAGHRSNNVALNTPPTGMTNRSFADDPTDRAAGHDTGTGVSSWSLQTVAGGGSASAYHSVVFEIIESAPSGLTITSEPSEIRVTETASITVTSPTTTPTLLNTTIDIN